MSVGGRGSTAGPTSFRDIEADVLKIIGDVVYCTMTTVDAQHRPRARILHPIFEVADGGLRGWAVTDATAVKTRHLAANPYVCCSFWSPAQSTVTIDCVARWVTDDATRREVWDRFAQPPPAGWGELSGYLPEGIGHPRFHVLGLAPWRVQVLRADQFASGDFTPRIWRAANAS